MICPSNITLMSLPPYSPELNPVENLWHYLRSHHWSNRKYETVDDLFDAAVTAWRYHPGDQKVLLGTSDGQVGSFTVSYETDVDAAGQRLPGLQMVGANQEHGILAWHDGHAPADVAARLPVGTRLRILPNHACATAAQFGGYHALQADGTLADWPRWNHW